MNEKDKTLQNHMARLGAGLLILKNSGAPISRPVSHSDQVTFEFEGEQYEIVPRHARAAVWQQAISLVKQYAGSCPGHTQFEMFAALEAAANSVDSEGEGVEGDG